MSTRKGEEDGAHFRSGRIENINGQWFFGVREREELIGPFRSRDKAQRAATAYTEDSAAGRSSVQINALLKRFL